MSLAFAPLRATHHHHPPILRARERKGTFRNVPGFLTLAEIAAGLRGPVSFARVLLLRRIRKQSKSETINDVPPRNATGKGRRLPAAAVRRRHISILPGETRLGNASGFRNRARERINNGEENKKKSPIPSISRFVAVYISFVLSDLINVSRNAKPRYR